MARISIRPIVPKHMNIKGFKDAINDGLDEEGREIEKLYKQVSSGFEGGVIYQKKKQFAINASITVSTSDERMVYLDIGTRTRWALMSADFSPKTKRRRLSSSRGSGRAVIRGRRAMQAHGIQARPGIEAREFSDEIADQRQKRFAQQIQRHINRAAKRTFP